MRQTMSRVQAGRKSEIKASNLRRTNQQLTRPRTRRPAPSAKSRIV
jgi:hypothetical protein